MRNKLVKLFVFGVALLVAPLALALTAHPAAATSSGGNFSAGNIIGDGVFFNPNTMSASDIQAFLNSKVPVCDTNGTQAYAGTTRAAYGTAHGYPPPFTCVKDYTQTVQSVGPDSYCDNGITGATKTAAQIITDVSQACGISPKALLVLLQKEQGLITDDWPWSIQYRSATGFGCPDGASCDAQYYGFFNQVYNAARQFKRYARQSTSYNYRGGVTSSVQYSPNAGCGSSSVAMQNQATAGLYNYTPYQPNAAALANLYGTGDNCSAYGNRNFWRDFSDWFGSTQTSTDYSWSLISQAAYGNSGRTQTFSGVPTVAPGGKVYVEVKALNTGNQAWNQSFLHMATSRPIDRTSQLYDTTWFSPGRPAQMNETSVAPGLTATFDFVLKAPATAGSYNEYFNPVADGHAWLNDLGVSFTVNSVSSVAASNNNSNIGLATNAALLPGQFLLSPDRQSVLVLQGDGNLVLYSDFAPVWSTGTFGSPGRLVMQSDGNLVLYDAGNVPRWFTGTINQPNSNLSLQTDGNLVLYNQSHSAAWSTGTLHVPDHLSYVDTTLASSVMFPGQQLETADRRYRLTLQTDGNLVLYSSGGHALWSSGTYGSPSAYLSMQGDGNLVIYDSNSRALWNSNTWGKGPSQLNVQQDGNMVIYGASGQPSWSSGTFNQY